MLKFDLSWNEIKCNLHKPIAGGAYGKVYEFFQDKHMVIKVVEIDGKEFRTTADFQRELDLTILASIIGVGPPFVIGHLFATDNIGVILMTKGEQVKEWSPIMNQLEEVVYIMHVNGIWHQDLRMTNVLLFNNKPKIIDYGAAFRFNGPIIGTILNIHDSLYLSASLGSLPDYEHLKSCLVNQAKGKKGAEKMISIVERLNLITSDPIKKTCRLGILYEDEPDPPIGYIKTAEAFIKEVKFDEFHITPDQLMVVAAKCSTNNLQKLSKKMRYMK